MNVPAFMTVTLRTWSVEIPLATRKCIARSSWTSPATSSPEQGDVAQPREHPIAGAAT
jgi:hypothetical protein